jgi:hypothetical protein
LLPHHLVLLVGGQTFTFKSLDYLVNTCADWKSRIGFSEALLKPVVPRGVLLPSGHHLQIGPLTTKVCLDTLSSGQTNYFLIQIRDDVRIKFRLCLRDSGACIMTPVEAFTILEAKLMTPALQTKSVLFDELGCYSIEDFIY